MPPADPIDRRSLLTRLSGAAGLAFGISRHLNLNAVPAGRPDPFPNVVLQSHDGRTVHFYDDLIAGKTVVINFMYVHCEALCPLMTTNLLKVQELLGERVGRDVFMYSLTLDPRRDTPRALADYATAHGVKPGWQFLTGKASDLERLRRRLGFVDPNPKVDADRSQHVGVILYGDETLGRWAACPAMTSPTQVVQYITWLNGPPRPPERRSPEQQIPELVEPAI
jgi:protein SCO1/2